MIQYETPTPWLIAELLPAFQAGPKFEWRTEAEVWEIFRNGGQVFRACRALIMVQVVERNGERRLLVHAVVGKPMIRVLMNDMRRLAAEWRCDAIETMTYNPRLARAMQKCGGRQQSINLVLEIDRGH